MVLGVDNSSQAFKSTQSQRIKIFTISAKISTNLFKTQRIDSFSAWDCSHHFIYPLVQKGSSSSLVVSLAKTSDSFHNFLFMYIPCKCTAKKKYLFIELDHFQIKWKHVQETHSIVGNFDDANKLLEIVGKSVWQCLKIFGTTITLPCIISIYMNP